MTKHPRIMLSILLVGIIGCLLWLLLRPNEPLYEGKRLSVWLQGYKFSAPRDNSPERLKADAAVRELGTNAIPTLMRMLREDDSLMKIKLLTLLQRQKLVKVPYANSWSQNIRAINGFKVLGETASNSVPDLIAMYRQNSSAQSQNAAIFALGYIGPSAKDAVSVLVEATADTNSPAGGCNAIDALAAIHSYPNLTIPTLIQCLGSPREDKRRKAIYALAAFGRHASNAVPHLIKIHTYDRDYFVRESAADALKMIDAEAAAKVGVQIVYP